MKHIPLFEGKVYKYDIVVSYSVYSKKKGNYEKTEVLYKGLTEDEMNQKKKDEFGKLVFKEDTNPNHLYANRPGFLYPEKITIKRYKSNAPLSEK